MPAETLAGTVVAISATLPATHDVLGFAALTFTPVGEVSTLGDQGRTYEDVSFTTLGERGTGHLKGAYDDSEKTFELIKDSSDAGQILMLAASNLDVNYAFSVTYQNGDIDYFNALTFSFVTVGGDANTIRRITASVRISRDGIVEDPA